MRRWRESGESAEEYAKKHDLHAGTLAAWASKVGPGGPRPQKSVFVPVRVAERAAIATAKTETGEIEVVLLNGRRVRISGNVPSATLARLLTVVEGCGACSLCRRA